MFWIILILILLIILWIKIDLYIDINSSGIFIWYSSLNGTRKVIKLI